MRVLIRVANVYFPITTLRPVAANPLSTATEDALSNTRSGTSTVSPCGSGTNALRGSSSFRSSDGRI